MDIVDRLNAWINLLDTPDAAPCCLNARLPGYGGSVELAWRLLGPAKEADVEQAYVEWRVDRTTTERLAHILNELVDMGRVICQTQFVGGRDWVVLSTRALEGAPS